MSGSKWVTDPPRVKADHTSADSAANATWKRITWQSTDGSDRWSIRTATGLLIPAAGRWLITWQLGWEANATGLRFAQLRRNGAGTATAGVAIAAARTTAVGGSTAYLGGAAEVPALTNGDVIELFGWQSAGGGLAILGAPGDTWITARWVALD